MAKVYIDPGHGGTDPGAVGYGLREKDLTLSISSYMRDHLLNNYQGVQVRMSRTSDNTVSLGRRSMDANNWNADVFVSVHINAATSSATGYEDFIYNGNVSQNTRRLQDVIHEEVSSVFSNFRNRGQKRANFYVLRNTNMSGILTENLFITNRNDANFLSKESNLRRIGEAHARGIAKFLGLGLTGDVGLVQVATNTVKIQTGGLNNENLIKVVDYFRDKGWYGEIIMDWRQGNPKLTSGGLTPAMRRDYESWLEEQGFWYRVLE